MMRSKKPFLIAVVLCGIWIIITYFMWMRQGGIEADANYKDMLIKLNHLEQSIKEEAAIHDDLMKQLLAAIKNRDTLAAARADAPDSSSTTPKSVPTLKLVDSVSVDGGIIKEIPLLTDAPQSNRNNLSSIRTLGRSDDNFRGPVIPVLVFACNRVSVRKCLDNLIEYRPNVNQFPIIVSQVSEIVAFNNVSMTTNDYFCVC